MIDKRCNQNKQKKMEIKDGSDFKEKIKVAYDQWAGSNFSDEWMIEFENKWISEIRTRDFIKLLKDKKNLNDIEYKKKERKMIKEIREIERMVERIMTSFRAEVEAFEKRDLEVDRVEYECPICGAAAIPNRYKYEELDHGIGNGCEKCGSTTFNLN